MDHLTPNKIQRLMHLAEDASSFNMPHKRPMLGEEDLKRLNPATAPYNNKESGACESSSGLLDLDQVKGFGESDIGSVSRSTGFHPGEMTGRSTGTEEAVPKFRHSCFNMESLATELDRQTSEVQDIMRHSIATNYSFHSKNLTADEESFMAKRAPLPLQQTHTLFAETSSVNNSDLSVGAYFRKRCPEFGKVLAQTQSPDRSSMRPSLSEVSSSTHLENAENYQPYKLDPSLDSVPVRQPRNPASDQVLLQPSNIAVQSAPKPSLREESIVETFKVPAPTSVRNVPKLEPQTDLKHGVPVDKRKMANKPPGTTDLFMKAVTHSAIKPTSDDTEGSLVDNSLSISRIAELLGNQSILRVSDILDQFTTKKEQKQPLSERNYFPKQEPVTYLKDSRDLDYATSSESVQTVISVNKASVNQENKVVPEVIVTRHSLTKGVQNVEAESVKTERTRSKSSSTRSRSTLSTVQENCGAESPVNSSRGEVNTSHVPSPNIEYKELDKSVDWHEVMQQKRRRQQGIAKDKWADITSPPITGFVGVSCAATISVVTLTDSWLTASFYFHTLPNQGRDLRIELPRQPLLLSPSKTEQLQIHITTSAEMNAILPYTVTLKDSSIDCEIEHKGIIEVDFKMPVVQAMSLDGINKVTFSPTLEKTLLSKTFVLISDSPVDLQLSLSILGGKNMFAIKNVQEIKKSEVNRVLKEQHSMEERQMLSKHKNKALNKQLCRLTRGNAIKATVTFEAPTLSDHTSSKMETFTSAICVTLIDCETVIKELELIATVGTATLAVSAPDSKIFITKDMSSVSVRNTGSVAGVWFIKMKVSDERNYFNVSLTRLELAPAETKNMNLYYTGPEDSLNTATLLFEEAITGTLTTLELSGGAEKPKQFPIKTNCTILSWVRSGRKEISLKNSTDKKVQIRCQVIGDNFTIDMAGVDARGTCCIIQFNPNECRPLPIVYSPTSYLPNASSLHLMYDKNSEYTRKISLYGCSSGDPLRWCGLATYGETALVRAVARSNIELKLTNKSPMPSFVCARVNFNLQYMSVASSCRVEGAWRVVRGRGAHAVTLRVDWARVERRAADARAPTLATLTALTGPELTRRRILRILKTEGNGVLDVSLLPENLRMLTGPFEGEDDSMDTLLRDFNENKSSLVELIGGLQELKAQIDLPQDIAEETIIIADDTILEHHTLYE
ncbi:centrosome assembly protein spindle defective 2 [Choristoneura fumiferana]|uniref:centrosome assembly protein spindle defective 2 n=1 Tax=Choristoneura fumiferana TaxID=7141 RepID=UPI003D15BEC1